MSVPNVRRRLRLLASARKRLAGFADGPDPYEAFQMHVEPALAGTPRVHRFAQPPVLGDSTTVVQPIAIISGGVPVREALRSADLPWVALTDAELAPLALERLGEAATLSPDADVITCDEDRVCGTRRSAPRVFPGPSPDHLLAADGPLSVLCVRREAALSALEAIPDSPAWRQELLLRLCGPDGAGHAHVPVILAHRTVPQAALSGDAHAAARVLAAWGEPAASVESVAPGRRRVDRPIRGEPLVEVVLLFRDRPELLARSAASVLHRSTWDRLRLALVDNGSTDPAIGKLLRRLDDDPRVSIARDDRPFNFAALNNAAVARSKADVVVFLNNDTEVVTAQWIEELLAEAQRPDVGAVAPLLCYPDGTVQHAGAALGLHGYAGHPFAGLAPDAATPFGRAVDGTRNWLAVTAACMMVERAKFDAVGGFDESFVVAGNDVDLCLRLTANGQRSLCVPHVELLHDESRSRGAHIDPGDFARSETSYGAFRTIGDPFFNPNLTLSATSCQMRQPREAF